MGHKEKANERIREIHFNELSGILDRAVKKHDETVPFIQGHRQQHYQHGAEYWDEKIEEYATKPSRDERIPPERLKQLLESKVGPLLNNNCIECGRLVKHLAEKYELK